MLVEAGHPSCQKYHKTSEGNPQDRVSCNPMNVIPMEAGIVHNNHKIIIINPRGLFYKGLFLSNLHHVHSICAVLGSDVGHMIMILLQ